MAMEDVPDVSASVLFYYYSFVCAKFVISSYQRRFVAVKSVRVFFLMTGHNLRVSTSLNSFSLSLVSI